MSMILVSLYFNRGSQGSGAPCNAIVLRMASEVEPSELSLAERRNLLLQQQPDLGARTPGGPRPGADGAGLRKSATFKEEAEGSRFPTMCVLSLSWNGIFSNSYVYFF